MDLESPPILSNLESIAAKKKLHGQIERENTYSSQGKTGSRAYEALLGSVNRMVICFLASFDWRFAEREGGGGRKQSAEQKERGN